MPSTPRLGDAVRTRVVADQPLLSPNTLCRRRGHESCEGAALGSHSQHYGETTRSSPTVFEPASAADLTHRRHGIIETTFADLIDGPLAHLPSGRFGANAAWTLCAAISHNLLRAAATMAGPAQAVERGATLRRTIVNVPARIAEPQRRPMLHLPAHRPWTDAWLTLWDRVLGDGLPPPIPA